MASKKIPCGGFGYDDNDFEFVTPMGGGIPTLKSKGSAVPSEVTNAIETNGMGWTDEDETVHQIDSKYIPSSGGVMVVNFEIDGEGNITANKTVEEVLSATETSVVIGNAYVGSTYQPLGICHLSPGESGLMPFFGYMRQDGTFMVIIYGHEGEWVRYNSPEEGD